MNFHNEPFTHSYSGILVPALVEELSYNPSTDTPVGQQQYEVSRAMAEVLQRKARDPKRPKPTFRMEHTTDSPVGGQIDDVWIEGNSLLARFKTTDDVATYLDNDAIYHLSANTSFNPADPETCELSEVSLVHIAQRPGSVVTEAHGEGGDERQTLLHVAASGTLQSTMKVTKDKTEEKEEKEEKKKTFRPRRTNEDAAEYMVKKLAWMETLPGHMRAEMMDYVKDSSIALAVASKAKSKAEEEAKTAQQTLLAHKARQTDVLVPLLQALAGDLRQRRSNMPTRTSVAASGTTLITTLPTSSSSPLSSDDAMDTDTSAAAAVLQPPAAGEGGDDGMVNQLFSELTQGVQQHGQKFFGGNSNNTKEVEARMAQMAEALEKLEKRNSRLEDALLQQQQDKEDEEKRKREERLEALSKPKAKAPPPPPSKAVVSTKASASVPGTAPPAPQRVGKTGVQTTAKASLAAMRKARQQEKEKEKEEEEEEEEEEEMKEEEQSGEQDQTAMLYDRDEDEEEDEVVDIDDEAYGELDRQMLRTGTTPAAWANQKALERGATKLKRLLGDASKRRRRPDGTMAPLSADMDPARQSVDINPRALASYRKKMEQLKPGRTITVAASGTLGDRIQPGLARESVRHGRAYSWLMNGNLGRKLSHAKLSQLHDQAQVPDGTRFEDGLSFDWAAGRCKDEDAWAHSRVMTHTGSDFARRFARERDPSIHLSHLD